MKWAHLLLVSVILMVFSVLHSVITAFYRYFPFPALLGKRWGPLSLAVASNCWRVILRAVGDRGTVD